MTFQDAALILAWAAIVILAFGMSGLMRQIQLLRSASSPSGEQVGLPPGTPAPMMLPEGDDDSHHRLVLFGDADCESCHTLFPTLSGVVESLPKTWSLVLVVRRNPHDIRPLVDPRIEVIARPEAFDAFRIPFIPMAVAVDDEGGIVSTQAVGSPDRLRALVEAVASHPAGRSPS